ncbi:MAG: hypothetical protein OXN17_07860 [Candidatus Poribacteria bacterium]|nr:hypothetical protein [Candidatus Poribacteria bacterium]MDE0505913.1 hypothetical protein [Candidatus Poribacteria bacterium]
MLSILPDDRRRHIDEAIAYYFRARGDISIPKLLRRFGIGCYDLNDRLYEIYWNNRETGELPFPPELNVGIDQFEQFRQAVEKYHDYLARQLAKPIASPGTYTRRANLNATG